VSNRYDPPANLTDFTTQEQYQAWSDAVSGWFDESITAVQASVKRGDPCQYYNQLVYMPKGPIVEQIVVWNALSGTLRARYGRQEALQLAETLYPLSRRMDGPGRYFSGGQWESLYYRAQDEYCEWRTFRDAKGRITKVVFTSEPPEYWQALHGDDLPNLDGKPTYPTPGDRQLLLDLYQEYVSPEVDYEDLICQEDLKDTATGTVIYPKGSYNPYNRWNTTDGIMHLTQPANTLAAEIKLGADATVLRERHGRRVTDPQELMCCSGYGGPMRTSDPTIGSSVNKLAALGHAITLRNPVGLYMHHMELVGVTTPDGQPVTEEYFTVVRGDADAGMIERAEFRVPDGLDFTVSDLRIGGEPVCWGSQLAERITVSLVGQAAEPGRFRNRPMPCSSRCYQDPANGAFVVLRGLGKPIPPLLVPAFGYPPADDSPSAQPSLAAPPTP
jgi:hypothetical protein